jgi:hypothetical protein
MAVKAVASIVNAVTHLLILPPLENVAPSDLCLASMAGS